MRKSLFANSIEIAFEIISAFSIIIHIVAQIQAYAGQPYGRGAVCGSWLRKLPQFAQFICFDFDSSTGPATKTISIHYNFVSYFTFEKCLPLLYLSGFLFCFCFCFRFFCFVTVLLFSVLVFYPVRFCLVFEPGFDPQSLPAFRGRTQRGNIICKSVD